MQGCFHFHIHHAKVNDSMCFPTSRLISSLVTSQLDSNRSSSPHSTRPKRISLIPILILHPLPLNLHPLKLLHSNRLLQLHQLQQRDHLIRIDRFAVEKTPLQAVELPLAVSDDDKPVAAVLDGTRTELAGILESSCKVLFAVAGVVLLLAEVGGEGVEVAVGVDE